MTTHVFIVDINTFKYHLEYMFAGTGARDCTIDFNNNENTNMHYATENNLVSLIADIKRIKIGDFVIFYLQQNIQEGVKEGKFFGIFKIISSAFLDNNDDEQFLKVQLRKSLTFRIKIEPWQVYPKGISEWEALDEIKNIYSPYQMLWSLIYRKLKGNRGNTMITIYESDRLIKLIRDKNFRNYLEHENFTFDKERQEIIESNEKHLYSGREISINIFPRLRKKYQKEHQFETHLQAYILENINEIFKDYNIEFLGNEVSCGVGMQRIDILFSALCNDGVHLIVPIELKSTEVYPDIIYQIQSYIDWLEQYYIPNCPNSNILPIIICRSCDKNSLNFLNFKNKVQEFNDKNLNILNLQYFEFNVLIDKLTFERIF